MGWQVNLDVVLTFLRISTPVQTLKYLISLSKYPNPEPYTVHTQYSVGVLTMAAKMATLAAEATASSR